MLRAFLFYVGSPVECVMVVGRPDAAGWAPVLLSIDTGAGEIVPAAALPEWRGLWGPALATLLEAGLIVELA